MKITIIGSAGGEVTGSAYIVQTKKARVLVDCGMFQGGKKSESLSRPPAKPNTRLDAVLLTHAHLDHTGRLPLLAQLGYRGPVFATPATIDMAALILRDSAKIQAQDVIRQNRRLEREGKPLKEPLYEMEEAEESSLPKPITKHLVFPNHPFDARCTAPLADGVRKPLRVPGIPNAVRLRYALPNETEAEAR